MTFEFENCHRRSLLQFAEDAFAHPLSAQFAELECVA